MSGDVLTKDLSVQARTLWAKTGRGENRHLQGSLYVHMADAGELGRILWRDSLPEAVRTYVSDQTGLTLAECEALVVLLASAHDIGKATPAFAYKAPGPADKVRTTGLDLPTSCESYLHAFMSEILFGDWLQGRGWNEKVYAGYASVIGGHHGANPNDGSGKGDLDDIRFEQRKRPRFVMGDEEWKAAQDELMAWAFEGSGASECEDALKEHAIPTYTQILLTGLVIMADWISSDERLFPLVEDVSTWDECRLRAQDAWEKFQLPGALRLSEMKVEPEELFHRRFPTIPSGARLRPVQKVSLQAARNMDEPGLLIIEAPMGCGKTEASLLCAEALAEKFGDGGLLYLLPTQATTNAMFSRVEDWLACLLKEMQVSVAQDLHLLHGKAELNEDFNSLPAYCPTSMGDAPEKGEPTDAIIAHQWFSGRKRGLLAPFVVGTVDQLLMAVLNTKHAHLRHLGLAGKVVVIDEVHAYDAYMSVYLDRALVYLGKYQVPVVLLSATLPSSRRNQLIRAYRGCDNRHPRRPLAVPDAPRLANDDPAYPLVTTASSQRKDDVAYYACENDDRESHVKIEWLVDDGEALVGELQESLADGGCACVLCDTVARAQETYDLLSEQLEIPVRLVHSRFIATDRSENDRQLVELLGKSQDKRPQSLVVVATQVVEQSLDLDFDLLITDIAPVDLLLQRMGRLHRHVRGENECLRPGRVRQPRCLIRGVVDLQACPPEFARGIDFVYQPAVLMRTICAVNDRLDADGCLSLPADIAPLVESVYEEEVVVPDEWSEAMDEADEKRLEQMTNKESAASSWLLKKPGKFTLDGLTRNKVSVTDDIQGRAAVRDSDESIEVVVVQASDEGYELLPWVAEACNVDKSLGNGLETPDDAVAHAAALCTVCLPPRLSAPYVAEGVISFLEEFGVYEGWRQSKWLSGLLPLPLDEKGEITISVGGQELQLVYKRETGLSIVTERGDS